MPRKGPYGAEAREQAGRVIEPSNGESRGEEAIPRRTQGKPTGCRRCLGKRRPSHGRSACQWHFCFGGIPIEGIPPFWKMCGERWRHAASGVVSPGQWPPLCQAASSRADSEAVSDTGGAGAVVTSFPRGTPRVTNRLLKRARDYAQVMADGRITWEMAREALAELEVDPLGLDQIDHKLLGSVIDKFSGGPVGLDTLAASIGRMPTPSRIDTSPTFSSEGFWTGPLGAGWRLAWPMRIWEGPMRVRVKARVSHPRAGYDDETH